MGIPAASVNPAAVDAFVAARLAGTPSRTTNIGTFGLGSDSVFPGVTPNITRARIMSGGYSLYNGLQVLMNGRFSRDTMNRFSIGEHPLIREMGYTISYALARAEATSGSGRTEFINNNTNNNNINDDFGPTGNDRTHIFGAGINMDIIGGFRLGQVWTFRTATPQSLFVPFLDSFGSSNALFTTDLNGDGGISSVSARAELLPGTQIGALGRDIKSFAQLNQILTAYNQNFAGKFNAGWSETSRRRPLHSGSNDRARRGGQADRVGA
ncbi:MAG: hypothetical protein LC776_07200 [Acidobacteria bacterium]|nr:hypothetical protein [Acidobacteriota bacterium]